MADTTTTTIAGNLTADPELRLLRGNASTPPSTTSYASGSCSGSSERGRGSLDDARAGQPIELERIRAVESPRVIHLWICVESYDDEQVLSYGLFGRNCIHSARVRSRPATAQAWSITAGVERFHSVIRPARVRVTNVESSALKPT